MGPLTGYKVIEMGGIGPAPFCCMILSDMGAEVIRVDRNKANMFTEPKYDFLLRGRRSIILNATTEKGREILEKLLKTADVIVEGFRPGKMEKLGLGPDTLLEKYPKLVYGRMTGWGQYGPLSNSAGHDINYIALTGALHALGAPDSPPLPPLNLVGDFGGGGVLMALGIVSALLEREKSGKGQVIDTAMTDGTAMLMAMMYGMRWQGWWSGKRGDNLLDGAAHFYNSYETSDNKYICIGSIEPQFYSQLLKLTNAADPDFNNQWDKRNWPDLKEKFKKIFKTKTRDEWCGILEGTDVCFAPVLSMDEAPLHPHNKARETFVDIDGVLHPAPAPNFSRTKSEIKGPPVIIGKDTDTLMKELGFSQENIATLREEGIIS